MYRPQIDERGLRDIVHGLRPAAWLDVDRIEGNSRRRHIMKGRSGILFAWVMFAAIAVGCSTQPEPHTHTHEDSHIDDPSRDYLTENFPTRDQMIQARECTTDRTGYEFDPLHDDYGPDTAGKPAPGKKTPNEVMDAFLECVFDLGLEDRFYPPWNHDALRGYIARHAARNG